MLEIARAFKDFAGTVFDVGPGATTRSFFGFKESTLSSADQAALFQRTFAERGTNLLDSFEQWRKGQRRVFGKPQRAGNSAVRVGVGVYLIQD
jgi:hypothetical protein